MSTLLALLMLQMTPEDTIGCPGITTYEMNQCAIADIAIAEARLSRYVDTARERLSDQGDSETLGHFDAAQAAWETYIDGECGALYQRYIDGSIRGLIAGNCHRAMIDERTHTVWQHWLTYADSTPPILSEPEPTPDSNRAAPTGKD